jgi:hypothetical protein
MMSDLRPLYWSNAPYAYWTKASDPKTGREVPGLGTHKFFRFRERVELHRMEMVYSPGGHVETEGVIHDGTPDRVTIVGYTDAEPKGEVLFEGSLAWESGKATVELGGQVVLAVSIRCDWSHHDPDLHSFHTKSQAPWTVPFDAFNGVMWYGCDAQRAEPLPEPSVEPMLTKGRINPRPCRGQKAWDDGMFVHYESDMLKVAFSTVRPRIAFLGWDAEASGLAQKNLILAHKFDRGPVWASGPWAYDFAGPCPPYTWGGEVEVDGQQVIYRNLHCGDALVVDVTFTIEAGGFTMSVKQRCTEEHTWLEHAAWKFVWDGRVNGSISHFAMPLRGEHRNGRVASRGGIHATGHGVLRYEVDAASNETGIQMETYGFKFPVAETAVQVGTRTEPYGTVTTIPGEYATTVRFGVTNIEPRLALGVKRQDVHRGLRKFWPTVFGFRAEGAGFSNNAFAINAMNCMYIPADMAAYTQKTEGVPEMLDLLEYTLGLALQGGPGYACQWRHDHHHDTAPALAISAGRIHQCRPDGKWLPEMWSLVQGPVRQILSKIDDEGRYICRARPGNRGGYSRSCIAWDGIEIGYHVAYASALAYRALRHGARMASAMDDADLANQCTSAAEKLKGATVDDLYNPETGWLAEWRSADGELHDHASLFMNAMAICFGMMTDAQARGVLEKLEAERVRRGHTDFRYGAATQLWPIRQDETIGYLARSHDGGFFKDVGRPQRQDGADRFGLFVNGCLTPCFTQYYLQAASRHGFTETADQICDQLLESFDRHLFEGSHTGNEFFAWDGMVCGYEGTLVHCYGVLYAIGVHKGWIEPLDPEW